MNKQKPIKPLDPFTWTKQIQCKSCSDNFIMYAMDISHLYCIECRICKTINELFNLPTQIKLFVTINNIQANCPQCNIKLDKYIPIYYTIDGGAKYSCKKCYIKIHNYFMDSCM